MLFFGRANLPHGAVFLSAALSGPVWPSPHSGNGPRLTGRRLGDLEFLRSELPLNLVSKLKNHRNLGPAGGFSFPES